MFNSIVVFLWIYGQYSWLKEYFWQLVFKLYQEWGEQRCWSHRRPFHRFLWLSTQSMVRKQPHWCRHRSLALHKHNHCHCQLCSSQSPPVCGLHRHLPLWEGHRYRPVKHEFGYGRIAPSPTLQGPLPVLPAQIIKLWIKLASSALSALSTLSPLKSALFTQLLLVTMGTSVSCRMSVEPSWSSWVSPHPEIKSDRSHSLPLTIHVPFFVDKACAFGG